MRDRSRSAPGCGSCHRAGLQQARHSVRAPLAARCGPCVCGTGPNAQRSWEAPAGPLRRPARAPTKAYRTCLRTDPGRPAPQGSIWKAAERPSNVGTGASPRQPPTAFPGPPDAVPGALRNSQTPCAALRASRRARYSGMDSFRATRLRMPRRDSVFRSAFATAVC